MQSIATKPCGGGGGEEEEEEEEDKEKEVVFFCFTVQPVHLLNNILIIRTCSV